MFIVIVRFPVDAGRTKEVIAAVKGFLDTVVSKQDGFEFARVHREIDGSNVINYVQWRDREAFDSFRSTYKDQLAAAVGQYGPQFSFFEIVHIVEPA